MKDLYRFIQSDYNITDGRFFTEDELKGDSKVIIAENDCGINVGDRLIIPDDKGDIVLNVIGLSDDFIVPYSFLIYHNNSGIYVKDEDFENEMKNTAPTKYSGARFSLRPICLTMNCRRLSNISARRFIFSRRTERVTILLS